MEFWKQWYNCPTIMLTSYTCEKRKKNFKMRSLMVFSPVFNLNITTENFRLNCETTKENVDKKEKRKKKKKMGYKIGLRPVNLYEPNEKVRHG